MGGFYIARSNGDELAEYNGFAATILLTALKDAKAPDWKLTRTTWRFGPAQEVTKESVVRSFEVAVNYLKAHPSWRGPDLGLPLVEGSNIRNEALGRLETDLPIIRAARSPVLLIIDVS